MYEHGITKFILPNKYFHNQNYQVKKVKENDCQSSAVKKKLKLNMNWDLELC